MSESTFKEASLGRRLWALFLDSYGSFLVASALEPHDFSKRFFLYLGILFAEISLLTVLQGSSFGQMVARLRVVDSETGGTLSIPRVLVRTLMILLVLPAVFRQDGRSIHDIFAKSIVVRFYRRAN